MEPERVYKTAMKRGDARRVGREMGLTSGEIPRRWMRTPAAPTNLFTGELSPLMRAKRELLAHDRVNSDAADILLFDLFVADVARQRAQCGADDEDAILIALTQSYHRAINALLAGNDHLTEEDLYRAGAAVVRALLFVIDKTEAGSGVPLMKVEPRQSLVERAIVWVKSL
jgi:hypothetical protein